MTAPDATTQHPTTDVELDRALERLFSLQTFGIKLGLDPITGLLEEFGNPHLRFPAIHVAGTNGKGSVCAMLASTLRAAGLRVGLYTSPHLVDFAERIRVDGVPIGRERLALYAREMLPVIERRECTFFEGTTALGFRYFAEEAVDIAIVETGMGGRLDATNIVTPLVSAITSISYDHVKHLGTTLEQIAFEKAGIIKPGVPAVVGHVAPRLRTIFSEQARECGSPLRFVDQACHAAFRSMSFDETVASFLLTSEGDSAGREIPNLRIGLVGKHQVENARVALAVLDQVGERFNLNEGSIREGFAAIRENTGLRGRFECVRTDPRVVLDVAHNADGARVLVDTLSHLAGLRPIVRFVFGAVEDKDVAEIARIFRPLARALHAVRADSPRSLPAEEIAAATEASEIPTTVAGDVRAGIEQATADAGPQEIVVVCGSFYVVGEAVSMFDSDRIEGGVRETGRYRADSRQGRSAGTVRLVSGTRPESPKHLTVKEWNQSEQPRERLMSLGAGSLKNAELLAILLRTGTRGENVIRVAENLIERFTSLDALAARDYRELQEIDGIGPAKAVTLAAAFELGRRLEIEPFSKRPKIESPNDVANIYVPRLRNVRKEQFHVLILNTANQVIRTELVSEGNLNSSIVHPREVYRTAIIESAASIIGLHNHPSGNPAASREDIAITKQLVEAGRIIGIPFHDHIIIAGEKFVSLAQQGYV